MSVAFCVEVPETVTEDVTLQVAGLVAPVGAVVTAQERFTVPVKPLAGATVTVDVLPVVAPAATVRFPPFERANPGAAAATVIEPVPVALV